MPAYLAKKALELTEMANGPAEPREVPKKSSAPGREVKEIPTKDLPQYSFPLHVPPRIKERLPPKVREAIEKREEDRDYILTREEERLLFHIYGKVPLAREGITAELVNDDELHSTAQAAIIACSQGLVWKHVNKHQGKGLDIDDLVGAGNIGLMQAMESFDLDEGTRFSTHATSRINGSIIDALRVDWRQKGITVYMQEKLVRYDELKEISSDGGETVTDQQIVERLKIPYENLMRALALRRGTSLDRSLAEGLRFRDTVDARAELSPEEGVERTLKREQIDELLSELTPDEAEIIRWHYGIGTPDGEGLSLTEIGRRKGRADMTIRYYRDKALGKLRRAIARREHGRGKSSEFDQD